METFMKILETVQTFVWGPPTLILLMGTGLYFTFKLKGLQICKFPRALRSIFEKKKVQEMYLHLQHFVRRLRPILEPVVS